MICNPSKIKLVLLCIIFNAIVQKLHAQLTIESITEKLKIECKRYTQEGKYDSAYFSAKKLKTHAIKYKDTALLINSYFRLGFYSKRNGDPFNALNQYNFGINLNTSSKHEEQKLPLLYNKCIILNKFGDSQEAQKMAIIGITIAKKFNREVYLYKFYNELAIASSTNLEFSTAIDAYRNALDYTNNNSQKVKILNNIGLNYKNQKKYNQAVHIYDSIINYVEFESLELKAKIESNLGFALSELKDKERSLPLLKSALDTRIGEGDFSEIFASYVHLTKYYVGLDKNLATYYARKAYEVACYKTKSPDSQVKSLLNIIALNNASDEEAKRYVFLVDSIKRAKQKTISEYTAAKFQTKEREIEIANKNEELAKKKTQNTYYLSGIIMIAIGLISFFIYACQRKKILSKNHKIATLEAREHERNNISGKVHDYVADKIREVILFADHSETKHPNIGFATVADKVENAYKELRKVSQDYMYLDFDKIIFPKRIQGLLQEREKLYAIAIDAEGLGKIDWIKISIAIKTELYRSLQELLINASKHSKATQISILFKEDKKKVNMKVKDNGVGCTFSQDIESTGLTDLKRRISNLNGSTHIISELNHGFLIKIGIPLK